MMKSFIRQLSWPTLLPTIKMLDEHKARGSEPGIGELTNALDEVIDSIEGEVFIVMDALDECPQTTDRPERKELLGRIRSLLGKHSNNLHILATSRPERDIFSELEAFPAINVEKFVEGDESICTECYSVRRVKKMERRYQT
jgi:hypothetical protein